MTTQSASGSDDEASRCLLLALSHDELGVIVDGLADPLLPSVAVALSSTCKGLQVLLLAALRLLQTRHVRAVTLCYTWARNGQIHAPPRYPTLMNNPSALRCAVLRDAEELRWSSERPTNDGLATQGMHDGLATLGMLLHTWLPRLQKLDLSGNPFSTGFGAAGMQALCEGLGRGAAPMLRILNLSSRKYGPVAGEALAAALRRGALPKLEELWLYGNPLGNQQGVAALAASLRKLPTLKHLFLGNCGLVDNDVASLVGGLGKDDFKALFTLALHDNPITDVSATKLGAAIDAGFLPKLLYDELAFMDTQVSDSAVEALMTAQQAARAKRVSQPGLL
tara:strand:- start:533 stop:1543 length:1011 start_codon:yes stop_codon:yes gene_type:complete